jgi:hypothetical protein
MLGDPSMRIVDVYVPAGHDGQRLPLLVDLVGFTSRGLSETNWVCLRENLPERLDRVIAKRRMPPVVAPPDCFILEGTQPVTWTASPRCPRYSVRFVLMAPRPMRLQTPTRDSSRGVRGRAISDLGAREAYSAICARVPQAV